MIRYSAALIGLLLPCPAAARAPAALHASYATRAAGLEVADVDASFSIGPRTYQMSLAYHTTGVTGVFFRSRQVSTVYGSWHGTKAVPARFVGEGTWRGADRLVDIAYEHGQPGIRKLVPPNEEEREPVPDNLQANTIDTLSALMELVHVAGDTGRCETAVRTYDGRRAVDIEAHTVGQEVLQPTGHSGFAGTALHCDFSGHMVAGFRFDDDRARESRPMHGSAWLAPVAAGGPPVPVRMTFETRWFGNATMDLTAVGPGADVKIARGN